MGCGSSMETRTITDNPANGITLPQQYEMNPMDIVSDFVRLDVQIGKLEATCPGPRMATAEAWVEHLEGKRNALMGIDSDQSKSLVKQNSFDQQQQQNGHTSTHNLYINGSSTTPSTTTATTTMMPATLNGVGVGVATTSTSNHDIVANTPSQDLANLALNLGVISDVRKASTHEDFFANLSESALHLTALRYYSEILDHTKVRLKTLGESFAELNELYINHDGIIALISGGTYMTRLEESLDAQLETVRDTRDKLGSALEQWRICGLLLRACANSATLALQQWRKLSNVASPKDKINNALQCRGTLQASLISLDCAQLSLPHVEIKYISNRQILAARHCNTYIITDIADKARYEHTTKVITAYESNMSKASTWLCETFNKTLRKDYDKAEQMVQQLAKNLRDHREEIFTTART